MDDALVNWEEHEKAKKGSLEMLRTIEEHAFGNGRKFFNGDSVGIVDIAFGAIAHWVEAMEEIVGVKILEAASFPRMHAWAKNFKEVPVIKENLPDRDELVVFLKRLREKLLASQ